jgi:hypothetical protein
MSQPASPGIEELVASVTMADRELRWIDTASQPATMEQLGAELASMVEAFRPSAVVCWLDADEVVLAHCVARALGVPVSRADENLGLLTLEPELPSDVQRVLMVASSWRMETPVGSLFSLLENRGKRVCAVVSLLPGIDKPVMFPRDVPYVVVNGS